MKNLGFETITVEKLTSGYTNNIKDNYYPVSTMDGKLLVRSTYQRSYVYTEEKAQRVIGSTKDGTITFFSPLIFCKCSSGNGVWELFDGQQRTISICNFVSGDGDKLYGDENGTLYSQYTEDEKKKFLSNTVSVKYVEFDSEEEKLKAYINANSGESHSELDLIYSFFDGPFVLDAKRIFGDINNPYVVFIRRLVNCSDNYVRDLRLLDDIVVHASKYYIREEGDDSNPDKKPPVNKRE